jgi:hypothetical protein
MKAVVGLLALGSTIHDIASPGLPIGPSGTEAGLEAARLVTKMRIHYSIWSKVQCYICRRCKWRKHGREHWHRADLPKLEKAGKFPGQLHPLESETNMIYPSSNFFDYPEGRARLEKLAEAVTEQAEASCSDYNP